ncbi:hypothetical protein [Nocardiopsis sp. LOL_012]|uniref:hypothetical protein n=1 Tax=Nocardiopsis sp. LOL_012 TaxID=3345409 RepID=UPI003A83D0AC
MEDIASLMAHGPGLSQSDWTNFGATQEDHMFDVQEQARILVENIQAAASEGAQTDSESATDFSSTTEPVINRPVNEPV